MPSYVAFGLGIDSEIDLPELSGATTSPDITIRLGRIERPTMERDGSDEYVRIDDQTVVFRTPHARFRIRSGRELTVDPATDIPSPALRLVILGRALGAMLQWRGLFVLHASAVARDGHVIAFAGASGAGKSTTAAAHLDAGWTLVSDDLVAIDMSDPLLVRPGYGQIKLWPDSAAALGIEADAYARVHSDHEKRVVPVDTIATTSLPLRALYIVSSADAPIHVETLAPQEALIEVLRHSYAPRIMRILGRQAVHLDQCARIVEVIHPKRLVIDRSGCKPFEIPDVVASSSLGV